MTLRWVHNLEAVVKHAWSFRLNGLVIVLGAIEGGLAVVQGNPPIDPIKFAALVTVVSTASGLARLVAQVKVSGPAPAAEGEA